METSPSSSSKNQEFLEAEDPQRKNEDDEQHGFTKTKDSLLDCKPLKTMLEVRKFQKTCVHMHMSQKSL